MSKLSFRARALDATKLMPVYRCDELPDLQDFTAISRAVPQMPTGMEKEEECEHHLQRAISAQQAYGHTGELVIPTPECVATPDSYYNDLYPETYKLPRQLIHVQPSAIEQSLPEYDIDSEDELWLTEQNGLLDVLKFEEIIEILEKSSGTQVVELKDAKKLIKNENDIVVSAVYDYWLNKRLKEQHPLIPLVKTEKRDGHSNSSINNNNPYIAFRRRTEKMQTRKNRKNDETSYEKMLKLKRDLSKAVNLLKLIENREKLKRDHLKMTVDLFEKRYDIGDFSGHILAEISALKHIKPSNNYISLPNSSQHRSQFDKSQSKVCFDIFNHLVVNVVILCRHVSRVHVFYRMFISLILTLLISHWIFLSFFRMKSHQVKEPRVKVAQQDQVNDRKMIDLDPNLLTIMIIFCHQMMKQHRDQDIQQVLTKKKMILMDHMHLEGWLVVLTMLH